MTSANHTMNPTAAASSGAVVVVPQGWRAALTSPAVLSRIGLGFATLCLIKFILLFSIRKELLELHWRVSTEGVDLLSSISFYLFALLMGVNLWKLGNRCMPAGPRVVRAANACVLFLGVLFILFTFHVGEQNYLNAWMTEMLRWKNLQWYLISSSVFEMPFLAAWVFVYGLIYYGLCRKGREHFILRVTAVFATIYIALFLRDFMQYRKAVLIADSLGIACLLLNGRRLNPFWLALPLLGGGFIFALFGPLQPALQPAHMNPEFAVLLWGHILLLTGFTLIAWRRGFLPAWCRILPFFITVFLLVNVNYPGAPNVENAIAIGFMAPRYFLGASGVMIALWLTAGGYRKLRPAGTLWWLDVLNLLVITLALADLRLTQIMHVRLDWNVISLAAGETTKMMWRMSRPYLPSLALGLAIVAFFYSLCLWAIKRLQKTDSRETTSSSRGGFAYAIVACLLLGITGMIYVPGDKAEGQTITRFVATTPFFKRAATPVMERATFLQTVKELGLADMVAPVPSVSSRSPRDLNVVVIFQESTYNQHLSLFGSKEDTQPSLSQYKDRMELFPNFFSDFAGSINARFATFTGLYPVEDFHAFTSERVPVKSIFEVLHDRGYACSMFYSSSFDYTDFRSLLRNRGLDGMYDADTMPGKRSGKAVSWGLLEEDTVGAMRDQIKTYAAENKKFFMTYVPAAPHNPFDGTPDRFRKMKMSGYGDLTPFYINELLYMDWAITSVIDQLKESGLLDKTLIVITADHGEMLGENGGPTGHGWAITPELANVPLIIMDPGHPGYHVNDAIGSQVDLMPTVLDSLGIPMPQGELYQGASLYSPNLNTNRIVYLNAFTQYGEIQGTRFVRGDRESDKRGGEPEVFQITDEGSHTIFLPEDTSATNAPSISAFDKFQKNLLRNYSVYCRMFHPSDPAR
jgi:membrane-anchored protein YejM (alkaline phosphatase superfamily)